MKKIIAMILVFIIIMSMTTVFADFDALYTSSKVVVDGKEVSFEAYNINDNNYFKLRDIAKVISGSEKQFDVTWNGGANAIELVSNKSYTEVGGELKKGDGKAKKAVKTTSKLQIDGKWLDEGALNAYNINDNNYFKLRDLGNLFNFGVKWDGETNCITINTKVNYDDESISIAVIKDNKNAIYSLTTDDGYSYTNNWIDAQLEKHGMVATMGLVVDWIGREGFMTWDEAQKLVATGRWGVANHTKGHRQADFGSLIGPELDAEINGARKTLLGKFPKQKILGIYTPGGIMNEDIANKVKEQHLVSRYAGGGNNNLPITEDGLLSLFSQPIFNNTTLESMNNWIDSGIKNGSWIVEMWHGVGLVDAVSWGGNCPPLYAEQHISYVAEKMKEGKLWVTTLDDAAIYLTQYNNANLTIIQKAQDFVEFSITDELDDAVFNAELTVNVSIPTMYLGATATQAGEDIKVNVTDGRASVNVIPDKGNVIVKFN